jgi:hypothetical protein
VKVRIATIQYMLRPIADWRDFERQVRFVLGAAAEYRPHFVLLPEIFTTQLLSALPRQEVHAAVRSLHQFTSRYHDLMREHAERGRSSFDRRHQVSANLNVELPWGPGRRWLTEGGIWGRLLENWRFTTAFTWQSGTPLTARIVGAAASVAQGVSGTLRANYTGDDITLSNPTIDRYFNTAAFTIPDAGTFGNSSRNMIVGPGSRQLDAQFSRDVRIGSTQVISLQLNANNLLNFVNYGNVDTVVNSPTFGQITSVRPMRSMVFNLRFRY